MNVIKKMIIGGLVLCTAFVIHACDADGADADVQSIELLRTSQSWNDVDLPDYPQGQPELVAVKYVIPRVRS